VQVDDIDLERPVSVAALPGAHSLDIPVRAPGSLQGFVGYFAATLAPGIVLSNYPCYPGCNWSTWNWPVSPPPQLQVGDLVRVDLVRESPEQDSLAWRMSWEVVSGTAGADRSTRALHASSSR
jgi:hypothetical protein